MYFALIYEAGPGFLERRAPYRPEHLARIEESHRAGALLFAGAFDPPDGSMLIFRAESATVAEDFARTDPYVVHGVVSGWRVRRWNLVVGGEP